MYAVNQLNIKNLDWQYVESSHFIVYYYPEETKIVPTAIRYLEQAYNSVTKKFNYYPPEKTPFFLFLGHQDFEQSNIVSVDEGTGGVTEAYKYRFLVPYEGSERDFSYVVTHEFTHVLQFNLLLNGFWKSMRILKLVLQPLWIMEGIAEYAAADGDPVTREMYIRDAVLNNKLIHISHLFNFAHLKPHNVVPAYKQSESAIRFIAEEYGEEKVMEILNQFKSKLDTYAVFNSVLGLDVFTLDKKWKEYLDIKYRHLGHQYTPLSEYAEPITKSKSDLYEYNTSAVHVPGTQKIAFITDRNGSYDICLLDKIKPKKWRTLVGSNYRGVLDMITFGRDSAGITISPFGQEIVFSGKKNQKVFLYKYSLILNKLSAVQKMDFELLADPAYAPFDDEVVFTGMQNAQCDLYTYNFKDRKVVKLTDDLANDTGAKYSRDGKKLYFLKETNLETDIYVYDISLHTTSRLLSMNGMEHDLAMTPDGKSLIFVSENDGVRNLYKLDLNTKSVHKLTDISGGCYTPDISENGNDLIFVAFNKGEKHIYQWKTGSWKVDTLAPDNNNTDSQVAGFQEDTDKDKVDTFFVELNSEPKKYKFAFSTDMFIPLLYGSNEQALLYTYWQGSDLLGEHTVSAEAMYSDPGSGLDYQLNYMYKGWRPWFSIATRGSNYYTWSNSLLKYLRKEDRIYSVSMFYPVNRLDTLEIALGESQEKVRIEDSEYSYSEDILSVSYMIDRVQSKYLTIPLSGYRIQAVAEAGDSLRDGFTNKQNIYFYYEHYLPLTYTTNLGLQLIGVTSLGPWPDYFRMPIRAYEGIEQDSPVVGRYGLYTKLEYKIPFTTNLNYYMWYMVPDLFFKYVGGVIFADASTVSLTDASKLVDNTVYASTGIGLRTYCFILQTYPLTIGIDYIQNINTQETRYVFIFSLGIY